MSLGFAFSLLALAPSPAGQQSTAPWWANLMPLFLLVFVFYFVFIRPQQKKAKEQETLLKSLKPGDKVITASGIIGVVLTVRDKSISIRSSDTKLEILRSAVSQLSERAGESSESNS